jgi:hypothetical protein
MTPEQKNEYSVLQAKIGYLILLRADAHGNDAEQNRINTKLDKLYARKWTILEQAIDAAKRR